MNKNLIKIASIVLFTTLQAQNQTSVVEMMQKDGITNVVGWSNYDEDIDKDGKDELIVGVRMGGRGREILVASTNGDLSGFGFFVTFVFIFLDSLDFFIFFILFL